MSLRVFELAKELNIPTKELIDQIKQLSIEISGNFHVLDDKQISIIKENSLSPTPKKSPKASPPALDEAKKGRRRIISVKKATENKKSEKRRVKKSIKAKGVEEATETEKSKQVEKTEAKSQRKRVVKSGVEKKSAERTKTPLKGAEKVEKPEVLADGKKPVKGVRKKTASLEKEEKKISKKGEQSEEKPIAASEKPEGETDRKEAKKGVKAAAELDEKSKTKPVETSNDSSADREKRLKATPKKEKVKPPKKKFRERLDVENDDLFPGSAGNKDFPSPPSASKYQSKKRLSRAAKRKERKRKQAETPKPKHTFNPRQKELVVGEFVTVGDLAGIIGIKVPQIIKSLMSLGIMATITQSIDGETAALVASEFNINLKVQFHSLEESIIQEADAENELKPRSPVVTIMGHVDHGKTSLLDKIRKSNVTGVEAGGITQHIGAYYVDTKDGHITFLDTPGHEAFTAMRARGADVTDIVILVVAADDGPRPQTVEAINHAKAAEVSIIVAINKCDKPDANPERTTQLLMEHELVPEEFGGDVPMIRVSAKTGDGIPKLLEMIHLQAEMLELKANPNRLAQGVVVESKVDKGRGNVATILVQNGTLRIGDNYVVGTEYGRVRAMWNDRGKKITEAKTSLPVEIVGLNGVPKAGDRFNVGKDEKQVRQISLLRAEKEKERKQAQQQKRTLENLFDSMGKEEKSILKLILKTDVNGSLDALADALYRLGNEQVAISVVHGAVGAITINDVLLATTSDAIIIGFNTRPDPTAKRMAMEENIDIRTYSVIYEVIEDVKQALEGMLKPIIREEIQGKAEILEIFSIPKIGIIAGSKVTDGKFVRDCPVRVIRDNVIIHDGKLASLQRFKDAAKEVLSGFECGIGIESYKDLKVGDELESYLRLETAAKL